jgi:hypothetical protein
MARSFLTDGRGGQAKAESFLGPTLALIPVKPQRQFRNDRLRPDRNHIESVHEPEGPGRRRLDEIVRWERW